MGNPTIGHNLLALLSEISKHIEVPDEVRRASTILNRYYISTRSPNAFPSGAPIHMFDEKDAEEAIDYAEEILEFAEKATGFAEV